MINDASIERENEIKMFETELGRLKNGERER